MKNTEYIALSKQTALWRQMDAIANNLANVNTDGFREQELIFSKYLLNNTPTKTNIDFVIDNTIKTNQQHGLIDNTNNNFDFAITNNNHFFAIQTPNGERYTRAGSFILDTKHNLVNDQGNKLTIIDLATGQPAGELERKIKINQNTIIDKNGLILNGPRNIRLKIKILDIDYNKIKQEGKLNWQPIDNYQPKQAKTSDMLQGYIEKSNVNSMAQMTNMINVQRSYESINNIMTKNTQRFQATLRALL